MNLSMHKFGSNVIEKCLVHADRNQREELIGEIHNVNLYNEGSIANH